MSLLASSLLKTSSNIAGPMSISCSSLELLPVRSAVYRRSLPVAGQEGQGQLEYDECHPETLASHAVYGCEFASDWLILPHQP